MKNNPTIAVVGASGLVGKELLFLLQARRFPVGKLLPFGSGKNSAGVRFNGRSYKCQEPSFEALKAADLVFFVSNEEVARKFAKKLAARGIWCIDDSSQFRMDPKVPLVIPEVNASQLSPKRRLIAGPNCTITGLAVAGYPIYRRFGIKEVRLATYQSVSGAGRKALARFETEVREWTRGRAPSQKSEAFPHPIAFNLFPQVGTFDSEGNSSEEIKVYRELCKIWNAPKLRVSCTAVRVPVARGHSLAAWVNTQKKCTPGEASSILRKTKGVKFYESYDTPNYPTPVNSVKTYPVLVGRVRRSHTSPNELQMWIVSDNLYKGAALNSVQIAEFILKKKWL